MTMSVRYCRVAAFICLIMALTTWATVVMGLLDPPHWNRVERFLHGWAWFYVGYIHWRLARLQDTPRAVT